MISIIEQNIALPADVRDVFPEMHQSTTRTDLAGFIQIVLLVKIYFWEARNMKNYFNNHLQWEATNWCSGRIKIVHQFKKKMMIYWFLYMVEDHLQRLRFTVSNYLTIDGVEE
jgi:hypothetical protein